MTTLEEFEAKVERCEQPEPADWDGPEDPVLANCDALIWVAAQIRGMLWSPAWEAAALALADRAQASAHRIASEHGYMIANF